MRMKDNFLERMNNRLAASGKQGRQDLELHDAKVIETDRAVRVLATYSPLYGPPSVRDVVQWVDRAMGDFGHAVSARADTIAVFPERNFITFVLEQKLMRQPLDATKTMTKAGVDQYLDKENVLWEVVKAEQGPSYIIRRDGLPVEKMLELRRSALRGGYSSRRNHNITLAAMDSIPSAGGGYASVDLGDLVDFYANGQIQRGKVKSVNAGGVKIAVGGKEPVTVDPQAITSVVEKGAGAAKEQDDVMRRYWSRVYPGNPDMTEIISPTSSGDLSDPRPLKVEPIQTVMGAASGFTGRVHGKVPGSRGAGK